MYEKLRTKREEMGLTQEEMAKELGYKSKNAYSLKERGERRFDIEEAYKISRMLNSTIDALFFDDEVTGMVTMEDQVTQAS